MFPLFLYVFMEEEDPSARHEYTLSGSQIVKEKPSPPRFFEKGRAVFGFLLIVIILSRYGREFCIYFSASILLDIDNAVILCYNKSTNIM